MSVSSTPIRAKFLAAFQSVLLFQKATMGNDMKAWSPHNPMYCEEPWIQNARIQERMEDGWRPFWSSELVERVHKQARRHPKINRVRRNEGDVFTRRTCWKHEESTIKIHRWRQNVWYEHEALSWLHISSWAFLESHDTRIDEVADGTSLALYCHLVFSSRITGYFAQTLPARSGKLEKEQGLTDLSVVAEKLQKQEQLPHQQCLFCWSCNEKNGALGNALGHEHNLLCLSDSTPFSEFIRSNKISSGPTSCYGVDCCRVVRSIKN